MGTACDLPQVFASFIVSDIFKVDYGTDCRQSQGLNAEDAVVVAAHTFKNMCESLFGP